MLAWDHYSARVACPACGDVHDLESWPTRLFGGGARSFTVGGPALAAWQSLSADVVALRWVREPVGDSRRVVDETWVHCTCGAPLAVVLEIARDGARTQLRRVELLDTRFDVLARVDAVPAAWRDLAEHTRQRPPAVGRHALGVTTLVLAPARCVVCRAARERVLTFEIGLADAPVTLFGDWREPQLFLGQRVPYDRAALENVARGLHAGLGGTARYLTIAAPRGHIGCACGAGPYRVVLAFTIHDATDELELVDATLVPR